MAEGRGTPGTADARVLVTGLLTGEDLISITLSDRRRRDGEGPHRVVVRPVLIRGDRLFQFEYHEERKVTHRNLKAAEAADEALSLLAGQFRQADLYSETADHHIRIDKKGRESISTGPPARRRADLAHNRAKEYILPEGRPIDFLVRLGVMGEDGHVIAARHSKFRQINRFLEMVDDVAGELDTGRRLDIVDFGSGKSYLTFALYHYLRAVRGLDVRIIGLDLKSDVVEMCHRLARDLGYEGLTFEAGDIAGYRGIDRADMVVSLHACDTATDDALGKAVEWGARVILAVPCCQHELYRQIRNDAMGPLLKHGILKERQAALVTDSLRAEMLEIHGYAVQVLEFIEMEHTPKNLLIRAVRRKDGARSEERVEEYRAFRDFWGARPHIEKALGPPPGATE